MSDRPDPRRSLGQLGERLAAEHLEARGLVVIDRNFRTRLGEIDLVASDRRFLVFCEVKTRLVRAGPALGPLASVGPRKRRQVRTMARAWLTATSRGGPSPRDGPSPPEIRFDAIGIVLDPSGRVVRLEHVEGAF